MAYKLLTSVAVLICAFIIKKIASSISAARFIKKHGCKPERKVPQFERFIGFDLFGIQMAALKKKILLDVNYKRYQDNGITWSATMMGKTFFNTIDPENLKSILATNVNNFGIGERLAAFGPLLGKGIFTSDGTQWEHSRALIRPNFTRSQVADLVTFESHIQHLMAKIPRDGSTVDLQTLFFQLTLDSATEFLFGESINSLASPEDSEQQNFGTAFDLAQLRLAKRFRMAKFVNFIPDKNFYKACKVVHDFVDKIVDKALEKTQPKDAEKVIEGKDGAERYVFLNELAKSTRDRRQLRDELLNILLAGRDTTASLLSITFHVLARRPDIFKKLKAELDTLHGRKPDYETLRNLKYLKYLLQETLRLYPIVPINARFAKKDTTIPRGGGPDGHSPVFIPKGQIVAWSVYVMHRRKDIYGPDAEVFRPERWAPEEGLRPGWAYLPFNGGPRICVGQQFALTEASYTIVRLLQEFEGMEDRDGTPFVEKMSLTMTSDKGCKVAMIPK